MLISDQINQAIKEAMKARDKVKLEALRGVKKVIIEAKAAKGADYEVSDDEVQKIIVKLVKQGKDSANLYKDQGREDLYEQEMAQVSAIESYLPAQLSIEEIEVAVKEIIAKTGASSMQQMGQVMGMASKQLGGSADGKVVSEVVKKLLS